MTEEPMARQLPATTPVIKESFAQAAARWIYTIFFISLLPIAAGYLLWRGIRQPDYLGHWAERFLGLSSDPDG